MERTTALDRLRAGVHSGKPIIGGSAGTGLSAKAAGAWGNRPADHLQLRRYWMAGRGSLAGLLTYGDANAIVLDMADEVISVVRDTPVLAGVNGTDPFRLMTRFLDQVKQVGFTGLQNFPTVGLIDGVFRQNLEETGMGIGLEVDMIAAARERGLLTSPYVFDADQGTAMAQAGADIVVLCHGGPIAGPADAQYVLEHTDGVVGFFGASSIERLPTERAIQNQTEDFKAIGFR